MEFDYEQYDGIETPLENLEPSVWDRGYSVSYTHLRAHET